MLLEPSASLSSSTRFRSPAAPASANLNGKCFIHFGRVRRLQLQTPHAGGTSSIGRRALPCLVLYLPPGAAPSDVDAAGVGRGSARAWRKDRCHDDDFTPRSTRKHRRDQLSSKTKSSDKRLINQRQWCASSPAIADSRLFRLSVELQMIGIASPITSGDATAAFTGSSARHARPISNLNSLRELAFIAARKTHHAQTTD